VGSQSWQWLIWGGRVLVISCPLTVVGCRLTRAIWVASPIQAGGVPNHWIPNTTLIIAFVWALLLPFLVLPIAPMPLLLIDQGEVIGPTVLGTRRVHLAQLKPVRSWYSPGRGTHSLAHLLRDDEHKWFIAWDNDVEKNNTAPGALREVVARARRQHVTVGAV